MRATLTAKSRAVPTCTSAPTANLCMRPFGMISCICAAAGPHLRRDCCAVAVTRATAALTRSRSSRSAPTGLLPRCPFACAHTHSVRPCSAACTRCARGMHASCLVVQACAVPRCMPCGTQRCVRHGTLHSVCHVPRCARRWATCPRAARLRATSALSGRPPPAARVRVRGPVYLMASKPRG